MKRTDPESIAKLLDLMIRETDESSHFLEQQACYIWTEIVGPGVNRLTTRRYVENGVLHVFISSAPLKNELLFHCDKIANRLNQAVGKDVIKKIEIH